MATTNIKINGKTWTKVADDTDTTVLIQASSRFDYQVATVVIDVTPVVTGHLISGRHQAISRELLGAGFIYAKLSSPGTYDLVVTK